MSPEERARKHAPSTEGLWAAMIPFAAAAIREAVLEEREACAKLCEEWAANYPPDVFPAHGESSDAKFGTFARHTSNMLAEAIRARRKEAPRVE